MKFHVMTNSNYHLTFSFLVILLGLLVAYPVADEVPLFSWGAGGLWLIIVLLYQISLYFFFAIVSLWHYEIKKCLQLCSLKSVKETPYHHWTPVYCHVAIFCSYKPCTQLSYCHLQLKTRQQLCSFASTVPSGIKSFIMLLFESSTLINFLACSFTGK